MELIKIAIPIHRKLSLLSRASWLWGLIGSWLLCSQAMALSELRELYRGARATAMGGAYVAVADDEEALFANPAGLAGIEKYTLHYMQFLLEMPSDIATTASTLANLKGVDGGALNGIMGKNVYSHVQLTPSYVMPNFGVGIIVDQQLALYAKNTALPNIILGYQTTNGVQFGYGFSVLHRGRREADNDLRLGFGGKMLWRRGGYRPFTLTQLFTPSEQMILDTIGDFGMGFGVDAGVQFVKTLGSHVTWNLGAAMTEIGDVQFTSGADSQKSNFSVGTAFKLSLDRPKTSFQISYDYRHILNPSDWHMHHHLGVEFGLPMVSVFGGLSEFYPTFGASFNAWLAKVTALSYREELANVYKVDTQQRYLLQIEFSLNI